MNSREQNIKNSAIVLAIILAAVIIGIMCIGIYSVISIFTPDSDDVITDKSILKQYLTEIPETIIIDNSVGQLTIKSGDFLEVSGNNILKDFSCKFDDGTLTVDNTYNKKFNISNTAKCSLTITVPEGTDLERLIISTGAGNCVITDISSDKFEFETGAGNTTITNLTVDALILQASAGNIEFESSSLNDMTLNCGVGNLDIKNSSVSGKCKIECGVGNFTLTDCELTGECKAECGVGEFSLNLNGDPDDYEINISSSVGKAKLNGKTYNKADHQNKGAANTLQIEGGVGSISINID